MGSGAVSGRSEGDGFGVERYSVGRAKTGRWGVYETHLLFVFRKLWFVDEFLELTPRFSGLLALGAGQLPGVH